MSQTDVIAYYRFSQWIYALHCYDSNSLGMHLGFWEKGTKNRYEAINNENQVIIDHGHITKNSKILDAGCGVGGTAFYIAQKTGAHVWGITISPHQVTLAQKYAKQKRLQQLVHFSYQDFTHTNFPDNFFDVVYGIESICYACPKTEFLKETYRILKPGGRIVIVDGYITRQPKTDQEKKIVSDFIWAFALPEMITPDQMTSQMEVSQFEQIRAQNMLEKILPSGRYYAQLALMYAPLVWWTKYIPHPFFKAIYQNYLALQCFGRGFKIGLATFFIHSAQKPKK